MHERRDHPNNDVRMALEGSDSLYGCFLFYWVLGRFLCGERFRSDRRESRQKGWNLSGGLYISDEIKVLRGGRVALTKGPSDTVWTPKNGLWS